VNEGIENALNVIVSTTGSSGDMKKELKTTIFDTVSILRKLYDKLLDTNESNARKITELEMQVANTNAFRGEVTGRTNNCIAEPSSALAERQVANTNAFPGEDGVADRRRESNVLGGSGGENKTEKIQTDSNI